MNKNNGKLSDDMKLKGVVSIFVEDINTGERTLWYQDHNTFVISGMQWILMKMFGLYLDSSHNKSYEDIGKDTTVIIPDLNSSDVYQLGVDPSNYSMMNSDISENHFVQGFMIGNGGSGEDSISTKNTDYTFTKLRNPIPFQQTQTSLSSDISGKYLGMLRTGASSFSKSYYIKKFDDIPHIYHSWWSEGQKWDYVDPVSQNDLGPDAVNGVGKTNRVETYCEVKMSLSEDDCISYFNHEGSTQTATVNELGLVAFDAVYGTRSIIEQLYVKKIKEFINIVYDNKRTISDEEVIALATDIKTVMEQLKTYNQSNINAFISVVESVTTSESVDYTDIQTALSSDENIAVDAYYNQNGDYGYANDQFLTHMNDEVFNDLTTDEAQRIKLITYYTFKSIPLQSNWKIHINYRIYAN